MPRNMDQNFQGISHTMTTWKPSQIKVLHLITSLEVGGAQHGLLLGLPRFDSAKYHHVICSLTDQMQMKDQFQEAGIEVKSAGLKNKTDMAALFRLRSIIMESRPDILHTYLLHSNVLGRIVGRLCGVPIIISSERTIGQVKRWGQLLTKLTNPLTNAVEVNSQTGATIIQETLGVPSEKIQLVRSGIDLDAYSKQSNESEIRNELNLNSHQHLVLYVGRLREVKGVEYGIKAFKLVTTEHPNLHLAIAGEGKQHRGLQNLVNELGINNQVTFLGVRNDLPDLFAAANSVLIPSLTEGFPRVAIEAMSAGKPIVATNVGGTPEAIIDGKTGLLVPPKDIQAMASALLKLINDSKLQSQMSIAGAKLARDKYSINRYVDRLDQLYRQLTRIDKSASGDIISGDSLG